MRIISKPNFFIVGAPKSGTTSLYAYLHQHPDVFMPKCKEPHFFGRDLEIASYFSIRDEKKYLRLYASAGNAQRIGEGSVWYLYSSRAACEIKQFNPEARIIAMLRNPADMIYSLHGQFLHSGNEDISDFNEALAAEEDRRAGRRIPKDAHFPQGLVYSEVVAYVDQIKRYLDTIGESQVQVVLFDDFVRDTRGEYRRVLEFLEVESDFLPTFDIHNPSGVIQNRWITTFFKKRPNLTNFVLEAVPETLQRLFLGMLAPFSEKIVRPPKLDPESRAMLQERFIPNIKMLEEILGRDLSHWYRGT